MQDKAWCKGGPDPGRLAMALQPPRGPKHRPRILMRTVITAGNTCYVLPRCRGISHGLPVPRVLRRAPHPAPAQRDAQSFSSSSRPWFSQAPPRTGAGLPPCVPPR